jgi:VanZ family protein
MKSFLRYWLPVLIWLGVIFVGSSDLMSAEHTSRFLIPFLRWLKPSISFETLSMIQFAVRKCAHLSEYAILGFLFFRAIFRGTNLKWSMSILCVNVWLVCVLVAATDEFHQSFVESRGASVWDVMIDAAGAIFGLVISTLFAKRGTRKGN